MKCPSDLTVVILYLIGMILNIYLCQGSHVFGSVCRFVCLQKYLEKLLKDFNEPFSKW